MKQDGATPLKVLDQYMNIYLKSQQARNKSILMLSRIIKFYRDLQAIGAFDLNVLEELTQDKDVFF